jgi:hypothetical protein
MRNPLRLPRLLKDTVDAIRGWSPHAEKLATANRELLELVQELRDRIAA